MVDVFFVWYNFCRVHQTLRVTPAMEAGWTDHVWSVRELLTAYELIASRGPAARPSQGCSLSNLAPQVESR